MLFIFIGWMLYLVMTRPGISRVFTGMAIGGLLACLYSLTHEEAIFAIGDYLPYALPVAFLLWGLRTDFTPLIAQPRMLWIAGASQVAVLGLFLLASSLGMNPTQSVLGTFAGGGDLLTLLFVATELPHDSFSVLLLLLVALMAEGPGIQRNIVAKMTPEKEAAIPCPPCRKVSASEKQVFALLLLVVGTLAAPAAFPLIAALCVGNFIREKGIIAGLSKLQGKPVSDTVSLGVGILAGSMLHSHLLVQTDLWLLFLIGLAALAGTTAVRVLAIRLMNRFSPSTFISPLAAVTQMSAGCEGTDETTTEQARACTLACVIASLLAGGFYLSLAY